jgi:hypothetical protein
MCIRSFGELSVALDPVAWPAERSQFAPVVSAPLAKLLLLAGVGGERAEIRA